MHPSCSRRLPFEPVWKADLGTQAYSHRMSPAGGNHARRLRGRILSDNDLHFECSCGTPYDTSQEAIDEGWATCPKCNKSTQTLIEERKAASDPSAEQ